MRNILRISLLIEMIWEYPTPSEDHCQGSGLYAESLSPTEVFLGPPGRYQLGRATLESDRGGGGAHSCGYRPIWPIQFALDNGSGIREQAQIEWTTLLLVALEVHDHPSTRVTGDPGKEL